jgi:16S rRNA (cytosine967-C5)-methyltransferase
VSLYKNRKIILEVLDRVENQNSYLNILLPSFFKKYKPGDLDKSLIQEISYGVIRFRKRLDWIIYQFLFSKKKKLPLTIQNILRMGFYQVLYLEKIPDYAIVNESVELAKQSPYPAYSSMVNAVLRNAIRQSVTINWPDTEKEPVKYVSVYYSFPEWLVERWINRFSLEMCVRICEASNTRPDLTLRINSLKTNMPQFQKELYQLKIPFQKSQHLPDTAVTIEGYSNITQTPLFQKGLFSIQDESSILATEFLGPIPGDTIIDMCSGPGGKTTHISQILQNKGKVIAFEINQRRLKMVMEESRRLGIENIFPVLMDSRKLNKEYLGKADRILVDAPCSGTGVIRKKPDLKWKKWSTEHFNELNQIQKELLDIAALYLKPGAELLYSTCSMEKEENDDVIVKFIKKHPNFTIQDSSSFIHKKGIVRFKTKIKEAIQLIPGYSGPNIDGFYMVKLKKDS